MDLLKYNNLTPIITRYAKENKCFILLNKIKTLQQQINYDTKQYNGNIIQLRTIFQTIDRFKQINNNKAINPHFLLCELIQPIVELYLQAKHLTQQINNNLTTRSNRFNIKTINEYYQIIKNDPYFSISTFFMQLFEWSKTHEGYVFWHYINIDFNFFINQPYNHFLKISKSDENIISLYMQ